MGRPKIYNQEKLQETIRERDRKRKAARREEWRIAGLCIGCGQPRDTHRLKCNSCYQKSLKSANRTRNEAKERGICAECKNKPALPDYVVCESCLELQRERSKRNRQNRNDMARNWRARVRSSAIQAYGGCCNCCGETEPLFLEVDHINGGGGKHRKEIRGGTSFYNWLESKGYPTDEYQLLCRNCNYGRFRNGGICPHRS